MNWDRIVLGAMMAALSAATLYLCYITWQNTLIINSILENLGG